MLKYSFVIPTYNNRLLLENTLKALNHLDDPGNEGYEVVVVDDGSDDGTDRMVQALEKSYPCRYLFIERSAASSRSATRNRGWRQARGEIIIFIDSDIIVGKRHLVEIGRCFRLNPDILVVGTRIMLGEGADPRDYLENFPPRPSVMDPEDLEIRHFLFDTLSWNASANPYDWMQVYACNIAVPKSGLEKVGGFDENILHWGMEDQELGCSLKKAGTVIVLNSRMDVLHQYHGTRNDLVINADKLPGFNANIDYFLGKHPGVIKIHRKFVHKFLSGQIPVVSLPGKAAPEGMTFTASTDIGNFKAGILSFLEGGHGELVVFDEDEKSDLDIWIQLLGEKGSRIRYFPVSRKLPASSMAAYQENRKREETENSVFGNRK
jgi:glycosyltransferase involved in cell wall biosynthesis